MLCGAWTRNGAPAHAGIDRLLTDDCLALDPSGGIRPTSDGPRGPR
jgi:hypothetical protein